MKQINKNTSLRVRVLGFLGRQQRRLAAESQLRQWWSFSGQLTRRKRANRRKSAMDAKEVGIGESR